MFRKDVEGLRALAVFAVLLFHFDFSVFRGGFIGVDIFFVISGYVISKGIHARVAAGSFRYSDFYTRRARRILPALMVTICLVLLAGFLFLSVDAYRDLGFSAIYAAFSLSNFYFAGETGYFSRAAIEQPLLHMWSLSVEEQFYLVWPLVFVLLLKTFSRDRIFFCLAVLTVIFVLVSEVWLFFDRNHAFYMAPARFFEFLLGAAVVAAERRFSPQRQSTYTALFMLGLGICIAAILTYAKNMRFPGLAALIPAAAVALMIFSGSKTKYAAIFSNPIARFFGKISYSLYLVHWPLVVFYKYIFGHELQSLAKYGLLLASIALAYLMWRYVEQPCRTQSDARYRVSNRTFYAGLVGVFLVVTLASLHIHFHEGLPWRLDQRSEEMYHNFIAEMREKPNCRNNKSVRPASSALVTNRRSPSACCCWATAMSTIFATGSPTCSRKWV